MDAWFEEAAWDELDEFWRERVFNILQDLAELPHLKYAYAVGEGGSRLTKMIGPDSEIIDNEESDPIMYYHLAKTVEEYLDHIEQPAAAHVTIELEDEMLFVGSTGALILVASFDGDAARGYVGMKLTKRISHLRNIFRASAKQRKQKGR